MKNKIKIVLDLADPILGVDGHYHYFYRIRNIFTSKEYYGVHSTINLNDGYSGSGKLLKKSIKKYGISGFIIQPLKFFKTRLECSEYERMFINEDFLTSEHHHIYNIAGGGLNGHFIPSSTREKISNSERGKKISEETRIKCSNSLKGRVPWNKGLVGLSNKQTGSKRTDITKQNISNALKKFYELHDGPMLGKHHSDDIKEKIRQSRLGMIFTKEHREHISKAKCGYKVPDAVKNSISNTLRMMDGTNGYCKRKSYTFTNINKTFNSCKELYKFVCQRYGISYSYTHFCKLLRTKGEIGNLKFQENLCQSK